MASLEIIYIPVTRKEFRELPMRMQRHALKKQDSTLAARKALDALSVALASHNHKWTMRERELYDAAIG